MWGNRFLARNGLWIGCFALIAFFGLSAETSAATVSEWTVSLKDSRLRPGSVARVDLTPAVAVTSAILSWKETAIPLVLLDGSLTVFFGIPRDEAAGEQTVDLAVTALDGKVVSYSLPLVILPGEFQVQRLTLPESKVSPNQTSLDRHYREQQTVKAAYSKLQSEPLWRDSFVMPVPGKVVSPFGSQRILNGKPRSAHSGLDLRAALGQPVITTAAGKIILTADHFFTGKSVYIDHGMGIVSMYFHLDEIAVSVGDVVKAEQIIGQAGSTGRSTAPHLHWGVRVHDCMIDPLTLLAIFNVAD